MLENALSSGILSMGVDVLFIGPLPTPGVAYVTRSLRADAGIVITASHNPYDDNGIKFFRPDGYKLDDKIEHEIENLVFSGEIENIRPTADEIGKAVRIDDALGRYIEHAKASLPRGMTLEGMRIVVDCAHGAAYKSTPCVLRELGAAGGRIVRTAVGDKNVIDEMLQHNFNFGGEQSGHLIFRDHSTTGDGLVAALQILRIMRSKEMPLSKLARCWTRYPQLVSNI